ncbi:hypothetical protein AAEX28_07715 [Lentisphaerota bacterium WC36G]|nr:hypothetical protein LJT99_10575 [Lentisphaerae bacterium WC36]
MNHPCGYDLLIGDWVKPYGQGIINDFIINASYYSKNNGSLRDIHDKKINNNIL